ncbi:hypothetical protein LMG27198_41000 [Methylocystis echinoides]|uniref:Uncharacterized protein n=1 Tax=Methylocystis echinoides TaxID=29468 RepID=A0A9W6LTX8_9HYPH|nr:hypothetical protein LMG27198_41000 [Methylocystis echinoides]
MVDGAMAIGTITVIGTTMVAGAMVIGTTIDIDAAESSPRGSYGSPMRINRGCIVFGEWLALQSASGAMRGDKTERHFESSARVMSSLRITQG